MASTDMNNDTTNNGAKDTAQDLKAETGTAAASSQPGAEKAARTAYVEPNIPKKLLSPYDPSKTETVIYDIEEKSGLFNPDTYAAKNIPRKDATSDGSYSIILPPPNVTGTLHLGHGLMVTIEDIAVRFKRMQGYNTLWIPGTDHAAIATQSKVEKEISKKEGKSRYDIGREEMLRRINDFAMSSQSTILSQVKRMGASCDWSRLAFTLDEKRNHAVNTIFKQMHEDGLIYKGNRLVNWDPKGQTTISDDEIVYEERQAQIYTFKYSKDFPISIATTRPETKVGDVAVAVHPEDERYAQYVGKTFEKIIFCGVPITIKVIADKEVDKEFGTGAVGLTPTHSMIDWEMAKRHDLSPEKLKPVIDERARMTVDNAELNGKKTIEAREIIVQWLKDQGLMEKEETITQRVSTAERTGGIIEPLPKTQWWVAVNKPFKIKASSIKGIETGSEVTLKEIMKKAVENGQVEILPEHFGKTYFHWIDNLNDWCISRQIWYGHRIPAWYASDDAKLERPIISATSPSEGYVQDSDTLDTWFSSGLWTFSTMGWPETDAADLRQFHPTDLLVTGYEILFFWVARMILMTGYALGEVPFKTVYLNGTVRDSQGRKMSKSLGNGGDPMEISDKYGADALRMFYAMTTTPATDTRIYEDKIKGYKHFANKIWNITRFILTSTSTAGANGEKIDFDGSFSAWSARDLELIKERDEIVSAITKELEEYKVHLAAEKIYHYAWSTLADVILEESKPVFKEGSTFSQEDRLSRAQFLLHTLRVIVKVLHPFMPHVTEELWSIITTEKGLTERERDTIESTDLLIVQQWPR